MKKASKILALGICLALLAGIFVAPASAASATIEDKAYAMKEIGLFAGTGNGFELDRQPTRMEGLVMFIRLLGMEKDALSENCPHPFSDVPEWASAYAGYAYCQGLTTGVSQTTFGANDPITAAQYLTFLLRALGYDDSNGDFVWNRSIEKALETGMLSQEQAAQLASQITLRGTIVELSWAALLQEFKGDVKTLAVVLVEKGIFSLAQAIQLGLWPWPYVDTLTRAEISDGYNMMALDGNGDLIYYDGGKNEIIRIDPDAKTVEVLLDVESAVCTVQTEKGTTTYKDLEIYQIIWDNTRSALMIRGEFHSIGANKDRWTSNGGTSSTYTGLFQLENEALKYVASLGLLDHILTVMSNGNYVVAGMGTHIYDPNTGTYLSKLYSTGAFMRAAQIGQDLYGIMSTESGRTHACIMKYDFAADRFGPFATATVESRYGIYVQDGLFYCWVPGQIIAMRPSGEYKTECDFMDVTVNDMVPLPERLDHLFVTTDKQFIFYDENARAIRMLVIP